MTTVEINGTAINYDSFQIEFGVSDVLVAPTATVDTIKNVTVTGGDRLTITEDGTTLFEGDAVSAGEIRTNGQRRITAEHDAYTLFDETVSFTETSPTIESVLSAALSNSNSGGSYTLDYNAASVSLGNDYEVDGRSVKRVFRDMTDRGDLVWWIGVGNTITVEPRGNRGQFASLSPGDGFRVQKFEDGDTKTVRNDVTVVGTGDVAVQGNATDSTSISTYGRQPERINVSYITSSGEANDMADALLIPEPLPSAEVLVDKSVGDITQPLPNFELAVDDSQGTGLNDTLEIEKQTITQGKATLQLGEGSGVSAATFNRKEKSKEDTTEPGSVYDGDRIADDAIDDTKLVDLSVTEEKLADLAVSLNKLQDNAVVEGKLADLSVSETKVQDDAITTPKLVAEAVTANEIEADTITAAQIATGTITAFEIESGTITSNQIDARTIRASNIATDELTANEIDVLDLETQQLFIGNDADVGFEFSVVSESGFDVVEMRPSSGDQGTNIGTLFEPLNNLFTTFTRTDFITPLSGDDNGSIGTGTSAYSEVYAYEFIDAATQSPINDGGDPLAGLADDPTPPDHCRACDDDGTDLGVSINELSKTAYELCSAQQRVIEDLEARVDTLESQQAELLERIEALEAE